MKPSGAADSADNSLPETPTHRHIVMSYVYILHIIKILIIAALSESLVFLPSPRTLHWKRAGSPSRAEVLATGEMTTGGATVAAESGETTSDTTTHTHKCPVVDLKYFPVHVCLCSTGVTSCHTFHVECCSARGGAVVVFGFAVVDGGVLGEDFDQQQRVLVAIMEELALEARRQSLGVFVPEDLRLRNAAHLHREASRFTGLHRLGLHVAEDLGRLRD